MVPSIAAGVLLAVAGSAQAQQTSLETAIEQLGPETVRGYIQPMADLLGANLNSGFFSTARIPSGRLSVGIEFIGMGALVDDARKLYTATLPEGFVPGTVETATILGGRGATVSHASQSSLQHRFSDGLIDMQVFPLVAPQIRVGGILGTEVLVRYLPIPETDGGVPEIRLSSFGVRHSLSQYLPALPVDVAASAFISSYSFGEYMDGSASLVGLQVSRSLPFLTVYGGGAWERSTMTVAYPTTAQGTGGRVEIDLDGANSMRVTGGAALRAGIVTLFGDVNLGSVTNFSGGLRLGI